MKIFKLPQSNPENFGPKRVRSKRYRVLEENGQLNLFTRHKILRLNAQSFFDEALTRDERGDLKSAKKIYQKCIEREENIDDAYCNLGIIACKEENYIKGINYFTLCLKYNSRHPECHYNLANTYGELGNVDLAIIHYRLSIEIDPEFYSSYFNLGLMLAQTQKYDEAIKTLRRFLSVAPPDEHRAAVELVKKLQPFVIGD